MQEFSRSLGDTVKKARAKMGLTQNQVAERIDVDVRTVMNIENYKGNPKMEILYPLIRALNIDSREIFHPEIQIENPGLHSLRYLIEQCNEEEASALVPIIEAVLTALRAKCPSDSKTNESRSRS